MTKWSGAATSYERVPEILRRALRVAWQGRPGVVHVCIPEDVLNGEFDTPGVPDPLPARYRRQAPVAPDSISVLPSSSSTGDLPSGCTACSSGGASRVLASRW